MKDKDYVVIGNFAESDNGIRLGSKVYVVGGNNGDGFEKRRCVVRLRSGSLRCAWVNMKKLTNFRPAWLPDHVRSIAGDDSAATDKDEAEEISAFLNERHARA